MLYVLNTSIASLSQLRCRSVMSVGLVVHFRLIVLCISCTCRPVLVFVLVSCICVLPLIAVQPSLWRHVRGMPFLEFRVI